MTMGVAETVGQRVRRWRGRRELTQVQLAGLAGLTQGYVSAIESGTSALTRRSTQQRLADALNITVAELFGEPVDSRDPTLAETATHVPAIRAALVELASGERRPPDRPADELTRLVDGTLSQLRNRADFRTYVPQIAGLLYDVAGHGPALAPQLMSVMITASWGLSTMGQRDLSGTAGDAAIAVAEEYGDPAWTGLTQFSRIQGYAPDSAAVGARAAARAADALTYAGDRDAQEVYGLLRLAAGYQYAIAGHPGEALDHLGEARQLAERLGEPNRTGEVTAGMFGTWFGPSNVGIWTTSIAAELGDPGLAEQGHSQITGLDDVPNRAVYQWADLARALVADDEGRRDAEAVVALSKAERAAPQHFRWHQVNRELVTTVIERARRRAITPDVARLAQVLGLDPTS